MNTLILPSIFKKRIISAFGKSGQTWLENLPTLITECEALYSIKVGNTFDHQSFNFTAQAIQADSTEIVIKLCVPTSEVDNEINALDFMRGDGIVQLLDADNQNGILLLERLIPGEMLTSICDDIEATCIAADVMQKICKPISGSHSFPTTEKWFDRLNQPIDLPGTFPAALIDKAKNIAMELHQDMSDPVLLHSDLHHFNILSAQRQSWLAIDPKGVVGPAEYECGAFLRNPIPEVAYKPDLKSILSSRINIFAEKLGFDRQVIIRWGYAQAILASVWCIDMKSDDWRVFLKCAETLGKLTQSRIKP